MEVRVYVPSKPREDLRDAIESLYHQASTTSKQRIKSPQARPRQITLLLVSRSRPAAAVLPNAFFKFTVEHCLALRTIEDVLGWRLIIEDGQEFYRQDSFNEKLSPSRTYRVFVFRGLAEHAKFEVQRFSRDGKSKLWIAKYDKSCTSSKFKCLICRSNEREASGQATT